jgi:GWxTD domain-containing protein
VIGHTTRPRLELAATALAVLLVLVPADATSQAPQEEAPILATFAEAKKAYAAKNWDAAEASLRRMAELLAAPGMDSARTRALPAYYFYSGAVAFQKKDEQRCREQLLRYFSTNPSAGIDPAAYPKRFVQIFEATREKAAERAPPVPAGEIAGGVLPSYATRDVDTTAIPANTGDAAWAAGPVSALLTDAEKRAYAALPDEDARRSFVARFWASLDSTPETVENEFQTEFYRRVQYADANFSTEATRGSVTDRGRVLLILGPPSYAARSPIRSGQDEMTVLRATDTVVVTTPTGPVTVQVANPKAAAPGGVAGEMEVWYYRGDRVPRGVSFRDLRYEFVTQRAYGTGVLQKEPRELLALRQAAALLRKSAD